MSPRAQGFFRSCLIRSSIVNGSATSIECPYVPTPVQIFAADTATFMWIDQMTGVKVKQDHRVNARFDVVKPYIFQRSLENVTESHGFFKFRNGHTSMVFHNRTQ